MTAAVQSWTVTHTLIPEDVVPGKRLGRHVRHDSRNLLYAHQRQSRKLTSQLWPRNTPILNQGDVGSCTGNEETGALGTGPIWDALPAAFKSAAALNEAMALRIYSAAETIDGDGPYPPNDNGSSGPSAAQAARNMGLISGYTHALSLDDVLDMLEDGPVGIGSNWYTSMDNPNTSGLVTISKGATVRGGHEYLCRGKDVSAQVLHLDNSWGTSWGIKGSFSYSYATLERLLGEQGDGTQSIPLSSPAPTPTHTPPAPTPSPSDPDQVLYQATSQWMTSKHTGANAATAEDLVAWARAKGYIS